MKYVISKHNRKLLNLSGIHLLKDDNTTKLFKNEKRIHFIFNPDKKSDRLIWDTDVGWKSLMNIDNNEYNRLLTKILIHEI